MAPQVRQKAPTEEKDYITNRQEFKLALRKKAINDIITSKRCPIQSIKGYNLSLRSKRYKYHTKRCWVCGSPDHFKADCPIHREKKLIKRVNELEKRLKIMEENIHTQKKNQKKRERKKKKKLKKKKKRKHQRQTKVLNAAVKIRTLILAEEATWEGIHALNGAKYMENMSRRARQRTINAYKKLFGRDLVMDMAEALCEGDDFFEEFELNQKNLKGGN